MEKLITVYRVENSNGDGPYSPYYAKKIRRMNDIHNDTTNPLRNTKWPGWWKDDITFKIELADNISIVNGKDKDKYLAGFLSSKDCIRWFGGWLRFMYKKTELRIHKYHVEESKVIYGTSGKQIAFVKPNKLKIL